MNNLRLGTYLGVPVAIHWSFLMVAVVVIFQAADSQNTEVGHALTILGLAMGALILHEGGHALTGRLMGVTVKGIVLHIFGGVTLLDRRTLTVQREIPTALGGPMVNLLLAFFYLAPDGALKIFGLINLAFGLINLIPAFPLDGGRLMRAIIALHMPRFKATLITFIFGLVLTVLFGLFSLFKGYLPFVFFAVYLCIIGVRTFQAELVADLTGPFQPDDIDEEEPAPTAGDTEAPMVEPGDEVRPEKNLAEDLANFRGDMAEFLKRRREGKE